MPRIKTEGRSDHILDSALALFAMKGFSKTNINDIAKKSHVASGTIYLYYENKEALLKACALRFHEHHKKSAQIILARDLSPSKKLHEYLQNRFLLWKKETSPSSAGSDLAFAMLNIAPDINKAEEKLWLDTLKTILKEGESKGLYNFESLQKELKIFLHCLTGFFPLPGANHPFCPTKQDLTEAVHWFDKKWRSK